jgi:hypothetical protein
MNTVIFCLMLAASLGAGIYLGARLARQQNGIPKSIGLSALLFVCICVAAVSLQAHPNTLACVVAGLASIVAAWIGAKSMPDYLRSAHLQHSDVFRRDAQAGTFGGSSDFSKGLASIAEPITRLTSSKRTLPSRVTPTGKTIRLVTSTEGKGGMRRKGHLRAAN